MRDRARTEQYAVPVTRTETAVVYEPAVCCVQQRDARRIARGGDIFHRGPALGRVEPREVIRIVLGVEMFTINKQGVEQCAQ